MEYRRSSDVGGLKPCFVGLSALPVPVKIPSRMNAQLEKSASRRHEANLVGEARMSRRGRRYLSVVGSIGVAVNPGAR